MYYRNTQNARHQLFHLAQTQGGYFTTKQAAKIGYAKQHLAYHVKAGNFQRVERGLFRIPTIPPSECDDLIRLSLWSRDRKDEPQAVVSHETALAVHELGGLLPAHVHLTVPTTFRKQPPVGCILHKKELFPDEIEHYEGFRITTALRTLIDVAETNRVPQEELVRIVTEALSRGLVCRADFVGVGLSEGPVKRLADAIRTTGR